MNLLTGIMLLLSFSGGDGYGAAPSGEHILEFAEHLVETREFEYARIEFERYLYFYPESESVQEVMLKKGQCFYFLEQWDRALETFDRCETQGSDSPWGDDCRYWSLRTYFRRTDYDTTREKAAEFFEIYPESPLNDDALEILAWSYLGDLQWLKAAELFEQLAAMYKEESLKRQQSESLARMSLEGQDLPRRSPFKAALLSVFLPGAGQFYARQKGDSLFAAILNGLSIGLAVEAFEKGRVSTGVVASAIAGTFYLGNIYGAGNAAKRFNEKHISNWIEDMKPLSPTRLFEVN